MVQTKLLQIILGEFETGENDWKLLYRDLFKYIWKQGIAGATVFRSSQGIGEKDDLRLDILEDTQFNNLPIIIDVIDDQDIVKKTAEHLKEKIPHGEVVLMPAYKILEGEMPMESSNKLMLKIYIKEKSKWLGTPLYMEVLRILSEHNLIWSTVCKGIEGFGKDHIIHKNSVFSFSSQAPIIIEAVGNAETIHPLLPELQEKIKEGIVIAIPCEVIMDR